MVLKGLIFDILNFGWCNGLDRTDIQQYILWDSVMVLKGLILG